MKRLWCMALLAIVIAGCSKGKGSYDVAEVSGKITIDGEALKNAYIVFEPEIPEQMDSKKSFYAPAASGATDDQGRFTLKIPDTGETGAVVGKHIVRITMADSDADKDNDEVTDEELQEPIPERYNDESELRYTVTENGTDSANFALERD